MGRSYSEPQVIYADELETFVIERIYAPDDEFAQRLYLDHDYEFTAARGDYFRIRCFEDAHQANVVLLAWKAGRDSVTVQYS